MDRWTPGSLSIQAEGPPNRRLLLRGTLTHGYSGGLTNIHPFLDVSVCGVRIFQGEAHAWRSTSGQEGVVEAMGSVQVEVSIPLPSASLAAIEERRAGRDAEILIQGRIRSSIAHRKPSEGHSQAGETRFHDVRASSGGDWRHTVAASDWVKLLEELGWSVTELLEVPLPWEGSSEAVGHIRQARRQLALGHWPEVLGACYKALEAALPHPKEFVNEFGSQLSAEARAALDLVIQKTKAFLHEGRHHRDASPGVGAAEAQLAILMTAGVVQYLFRR